MVAVAVGVAVVVVDDDDDVEVVGNAETRVTHKKRGFQFLPEHSIYEELCISFVGVTQQT